MHNSWLLTFEDQNTRTFMIDGEPWFAAIDLCKVFAIKNHNDAISDLEDYEKAVMTSETRGGRQKIAIVNESGLYSLAFRSTKPEAIRFKKWVTTEVLPSIRRFGMYPPPVTTLQLSGQVWDEGRAKTAPERFTEERLAWEGRSGHSFETIISKFKIKILEAGPPKGMADYLSRDDLWMQMMSLGFDLRYIMWGERTQTRDEKQLIDAFRSADETGKLALLGRAMGVAGPSAH